MSSTEALHARYRLFPSYRFLEEVPSGSLFTATILEEKRKIYL